VERRVVVVWLTAILAILLAALALAFVVPSPPTRTLTVEQLRAGVEFDLAKVHVRETHFRDLSQVDAGISVTFALAYADGYSESVSFVFATFLCSNVQVTSVHRNPGVIFRYICGQNSILVGIL
jgi:hypothetical protein